MKKIKSPKQVLKEIVNEAKIPILVGALAGAWLSEVSLYYFLKKYLEKPRAEFIDRDKLPDLVIGNRTYLADKIEEDWFYRRLNSSDIYFLDR